MSSAKEEIKNLLKENKIAALKRFGQNFLISEEVINKIIESASVNSQDIVLEIGPGLGVITFELAKKAKKVIAIEKDRKFFEILEKKVKALGIKNISLVNNDALNFQFTNFQFTNYKMVANLPYNIAAAVIMKFLEAENSPQIISVMVQKEVAQRICAKPPRMNKLAIFSQLYSTPKIIDIVPPSAFWPKPKVDSAILQLMPKFSWGRPPGNFEPKLLGGLPPENFSKTVSAGFSHPRKTLLNNFAKIAKKEVISQWLKENNINPSQRPETLTIHNWLSLAKTLKTLHNN